VHGVLTVEEIIQKSSNVGTVHMAMKFDRQHMWDLYTHLGFGQAPQMGFPGAVAGRLRPYKNWRPIEQATMSYGHGVSVSLIQMARAYSVFARDGDLIPVSMLKTDAQATGVQVFKPETARAVRKMLEMAVGPDGTAPKAQIRDYRVAGKTGTAHKQEDGKYVNKYVASFVGLAPASNPRLVVAVMIDEPNAGKYYAGDVAAPLFSKLTGDALRALRVAPDAPGANIVIPSEPVKESL
jgi:cell division protein FtsI (penicillin-binding protein 3)